MIDLRFQLRENKKCTIHGSRAGKVKRGFIHVDDVIDAVDVVDIVTPTVSHYACAEKAARKSKHIFIYKLLVIN